MTRVLLTGAEGQLGGALQVSVPDGMKLLSLGVDRLDITDKTAVQKICREFQPEVVINAAAYTAVDRAEEEPDVAWSINRDGAGHLAQAASVAGACLIQISTDFIFDGEQSHPYLPTDKAAPIGIYGASKLGGERVLREQPGLDWLILRTAWVYASHGNNFVKTMLRLMRDGTDLRVVADQVGSPTWATGLAGATWQAVIKNTTGIHHWTDAGVASWYDFAVAIQEEAVTQGLVESPVRITPVRTEDYPTPARRPAYSVLDKTRTWQELEITPVHWRDNLRAMLSEIDARDL